VEAASVALKCGASGENHERAAIGEKGVRRKEAKRRRISRKNGMEKLWHVCQQSISGICNSYNMVA